MRADEHRLREGLQHWDKLVRVGILIPGIASMQQHRQPPCQHFEHPHAPGLVQRKALNIRVQLDPVQPQIQDLLDIRFHILAVRMQGPEADQARRGFCLTGSNKLVDSRDLGGLRRHGMDELHGNASRILHPSQLRHRPRRSGQADAVKCPGGAGRLLGDLIWVDMAVEI